MKKLLIAFCSLSSLIAISPALAGMSMLCDIGTVRIQSNDLIFQDGHLTMKGVFYIESRSHDFASRPMFLKANGNGSSQLNFSWTGVRDNVFNTEFGDIILMPIADSPRVDIEFPKPDYDTNGKVTINHTQRMKQQGCILQ